MSHKGHKPRSLPTKHCAQSLKTEALYVFVSVYLPTRAMMSQRGSGEGAAHGARAGIEFQNSVLADQRYRPSERASDSAVRSARLFTVRPSVRPHAASVDVRSAASAQASKTRTQSAAAAPHESKAPPALPPPHSIVMLLLLSFCNVAAAADGSGHICA